MFNIVNYQEFLIMNTFKKKRETNTSSSIAIHQATARRASALHISKRSGQSCCSPWALKNSGSFTVGFEPEHCKKTPVTMGYNRQKPSKAWEDVMGRYEKRNIRWFSVSENGELIPTEWH